MQKTSKANAPRFVLTRTGLRGGLAASYVARRSNRPIVIWYGEELTA
jgi:hypothetical protein